MKKTLVALAVLAVSGAAMAQSSVTLYGIADMMVHKDKGSDMQMTSGGIGGSRWGVMGTEDLGGGLAANFLFEQGIDLENGATAGGFNRQAYLGLSGGFGEIKLGNVYTAYDDIEAAASPLFDSNLLNPAEIWASTLGYNANPGSNLYYATPDFGGASGAISYTRNGSGNDLVSLHVKYEGGPLFVGFAYQDESDFVVGGDKFTRLNGTYDFGSFKLLAGYGRTNLTKNTDLSIGADVPLSANLTLSAGYASTKAKGGVRGSSFAVGASYSLSKRTSIYGGLRNDNAEAVTNYGGVDSRIGVGIKHTF